MNYLRKNTINVLLFLLWLGLGLSLTTARADGANRDTIDPAVVVSNGYSVK